MIVERSISRGTALHPRSARRQDGPVPALPAVPLMLALALAQVDPATALTLDAARDAHGTAVVATASTADGSPAQGVVVLAADGVPVATLPLDDAGRASLTTDALRGRPAATLTASWAPTAEAAGGGAPGAAAVAAAAVPDEVTGTTTARADAAIVVTIPAGALTLTAPVTTSADCRRSTVVVTDTRPGARGFTVTLALADGRATAPARLMGTTAVQVPGNGLPADRVRVVAPGAALAPGAGLAVARLPGEVSGGSVGVEARLATCPGTLVWTAS